MIGSLRGHFLQRFLLARKSAHSRCSPLQFPIGCYEFAARNRANLERVIHPRFYFLNLESHRPDALPPPPPPTPLLSPAHYNTERHFYSPLHPPANTRHPSLLFIQKMYKMIFLSHSPTPRLALITAAPSAAPRPRPYTSQSTIPL